MTLEKSLRLEALEALRAAKCDCGRAKRSGQSFCSRCYYSLPESTRKDLYLGWGGGYEEAWDEARDFLRQERRVGRSS